MPTTRPTRPIRYGDLCAYQDKVVLVMGNCSHEDDTIWCAEYVSGVRCDPPAADLKRLPQRQQHAWDEVKATVTRWAHEGNSDALWWLAWLYEGSNHPRSVWYYIAAMRRNPEAHGWALSRVYSDSRNPIMSEGVTAPDTGFLVEIAEFNGAKVWGDWQEAVTKAANAVHIAADKG